MNIIQSIQFIANFFAEIHTACLLSQFIFYNSYSTLVDFVFINLVSNFIFFCPIMGKWTFMRWKSNRRKSIIIGSQLQKSIKNESDCNMFFIFS